MSKWLLKLCLPGLVFLSFGQGLAQTVSDSAKRGQMVIVEMENGDEYQGKILSKEREIIVLETVNGKFNLIAENVRAITEYNYEGEFGFANPHDTRYFFGPTAMPIGKGKGYYQNILVSSNFANYGITNDLSVGGGFEFISTVTGSPIWFLTPKVGFNVAENFYAGGGFIMAGFAAEGTATLGYGVATLGDAETNLSLGVGYGLLDGAFSDYPAIMISGTHRVSNNISLLTENYVLPNSSPGSIYFGIHGIRILSKKNSFDIGAIVIPEIASEVPALPYVGYVRVF